MARAYFDGTSPNSEMKYRNAGRPGFCRHSVGCCHPTTNRDFLFQSIKLQHCCQRFHLMPGGNVQQSNNLALFIDHGRQAWFIVVAAGYQPRP
jgi:hypothetical protein